MPGPSYPGEPGAGPQSLWGTAAPGQAVDQATAGISQVAQYHRPLPPSVVAPPLANQGAIDQSQASAVCYHFASLPTPPPYSGTELPSSPALPAGNWDSVNPFILAGQPIYGSSVTGHRGSYRTLTQEPGVVATAGAVTRPIAGYAADNVALDIHTPHLPLHPTQNHDAVTSTRVIQEPYGQIDQQLDHEAWATGKLSTLADTGEGRSALAHAPVNSHCADAAEDHLDNEGPPDRKKRARFEEELRRQTSNTRSIGACLRCRNQRIRCVPNKSEKSNPLAPCETCRRVRRDSKKTIHYIPCVRFKLTSMTIYRAGGLGYTTRFDHTKLVNIVDYNDEPIEIRMSQGLCHHPMSLKVRRFKPRETDKTHWCYLENGVPVAQDTGAFCLADVEKTAKEFSAYVKHYALEGLRTVGEESDDLVKHVFHTIAAHCDPSSSFAQSGDDSGTANARKYPDQKDFLLKIVRLWFAIRHGTGSAWLDGDENLGLRPGFGPNNPHRGKILVSRMIVAQFDSIRHECIYKKLAPEVLRTFDTFLASSNKEAWFTVFLATFLLLHQVARTSQDRYRHAKQYSRGNQLDTRYGNLDNPLTGFVENVHHSAAMLLARWQYFKRCDLMNFDWDDIGQSTLMFLEPDQVECLKVTVNLLKEKLPLIPTTPDQGCWENELFWISKMFVTDQSSEGYWKPPEIFSCARPSVGRE
ncbi:uncharacterized protein P884DRAFT_206842 [Thermothelomyces heterothallicus CBS 202.75]|uniref:uncharacterized protein n=1 Tax=Thermothelomyces heterothallicus CBS 202.75 TaxID=1149848 RepID=UPI0037440DE9